MSDTTVVIVKPDATSVVVGKVTTTVIATGTIGPRGPQGPPGAGDVDSVNGKQGVVVLNASDVGADAAGDAAAAQTNAETYTDTQVSAETTARANADTTEATARAVADALLVPLSDLDTDGTLAADSDAKVATQKATKTYADAVSATASAAVATETAARIAVDTAEASTRAAADTANATAIANEATARAAADVLLVPLSDLDVDGALAANSDAKIATQKATKTYVDAETTARAAAVTSEATTRAAADTANASAITAEATTRAAADTSEASARVAGDAASVTTAEAYANTHKLDKSANLSDVGDIQKSRTYINGSNEVALQHAKQALATSDTAPFVLVELGDSFTEGVGLTLEQTHGHLLHQTLAESVALPSLGSGYCCANAVTGSKWTGDAGTLGTNGLGNRSWDSAAGVTNTHSLTVTCDRLKLFYTKGPNYGAFTVKVDGVTVATLDSYNAGGLVAASWDSGALTLGSHTIRIDSINTGSAKPVATFAVSIAGAFAYWGNFSTGVQNWNGGHSFAGSWIPSAVELGYLALINPDLVILAYGANDPTLSVAAATTRTNFISAQSAIAGAISHPVSFAFVATWGKNTEPTWSTYVPQIRDAAATAGATFVDIYAAMGQRSDTVISDSTGHPTSEASFLWRDVFLEQLPLVRARNDGLRYWRVAGETGWRLRMGMGVAPFIGYSDGASVVDLAQIAFSGSELVVSGANLKVPALDLAGLTGATSAARIVGGVSGAAPVSGTFAVGDVVVDEAGGFYVCSVAGTPGTWKQIPNSTFVAALISAAVGPYAPLAGAAFTGAISSTGAEIELGDGTAAHGDARIITNAFGTTVGIFGSTADADNQPKSQLASDGWRGGPGGAGLEVSVLRSATNEITLTASAGVKTSAGLTVGGTLTLSAHNIATDTTTGMQIATGTTQKLGLFGVTPVTARTGWGTPTGTLARSALADPTYTTTGGTGATAGAFDTAAHRDAIITAVFNNSKALQALITDLLSLGVIHS